jgi:hypothetical protein
LGQTSAKVNEVLREAKGGILFIDEAYNLGQGPYGKEACDTIVAAMTSDDFQDVQIVIAGYPREIEEMFRANSGLKSRFTHFFDFPDWTDEDCVEFFCGRARREGFAELGEDARGALRSGFAELLALEGWANGRDVVRVYDEAQSLRAERVYDAPAGGDGGGPKALHTDDVRGALASTIRSRRPVTAGRKTRGPSGDEAATVAQLEHRAPPPPRPAAQLEETALETSAVQESQAPVVAEESAGRIEQDLGGGGGSDEGGGDGNGRGESGFGGECQPEEQQQQRDEGVPDRAWDELQDAKRREQREEEERARVLADLEQLRREEEEARIRHEHELERIRLEVEREEQERARRLAEEEEERRRAEEERRLRILEEERRMLEEEARRREAIRQKLIVIGNCPMGFTWHQVGGGWRCGGGSHFVSDEQLERQFGHEVDG